MSSTPLTTSSRADSPSREQRMSLQGRLGSLFNNSPRSSQDRSRPASPPPSGTRVNNVVDPSASGVPVASSSTHQQDTREMTSRAASIASPLKPGLHPSHDGLPVQVPLQSRSHRLLQCQKHQESWFIDVTRRIHSLDRSRASVAHDRNGNLKISPLS